MTNVSRYLVIGSGILSILLISIGLFIPSYETYRNLGTNLFGVSIMALIALITFEKMESSTEKTVEGIKSSTDETLAKMEEFSDKQIQENKKIAAELKDSNEKLAEVYGSLKTLADDVEERRKTCPKLGVRFTSGQEEITLSTGGEKVVEFVLNNRGRIMAESSDFEIYFPPQIEILESGKAVTMKLNPDTLYPDHTGIFFERGNFPADSHYVVSVKLKIAPAAVKKFKIPFRCVCKNHPLEHGVLAINAIG